MKKTVVIGASENPERTSFQTIISLTGKNNSVVAIGNKEGEVNGIKILKGQPKIDDVDTITMYVGPKNQITLYDYILSMKPRRIIFNPGAENPEFEKICEQNNIEVLEACTLTMLSVGNY